MDFKKLFTISFAITVASLQFSHIFQIVKFTYYCTSTTVYFINNVVLQCTVGVCTKRVYLRCAVQFTMYTFEYIFIIINNKHYEQQPTAPYTVYCILLYTTVYTVLQYFYCICSIPYTVQQYRQHNIYYLHSTERFLLPVILNNLELKLTVTNTDQ